VTRVPYETAMMKWFKRKYQVFSIKTSLSVN
jgi:hypothetical protein